MLALTLILALTFQRSFSHASTSTTPGGCPSFVPEKKAGGMRLPSSIVVEPSSGVRKPPKRESKTLTLSGERRSSLVGTRGDMSSSCMYDGLVDDGTLDDAVRTSAPAPSGPLPIRKPKSSCTNGRRMPMTATLGSRRLAFCKPRKPSTPTCSAIRRLSGSIAGIGSGCGFNPGRSATLTPSSI